MGKDIKINYERLTQNLMDIISLIFLWVYLSIGIMKVFDGIFVYIVMIMGFVLFIRIIIKYDITWKKRKR